ncbi:MAG: hypothetical protein KDA32_03025 [Phycisphaerales bacterium]|nr:hypothetical protein [Phycisphaerales bacterium]
MADPTPNLASTAQGDDPVAGPVFYIGVLLGLSLLITVFAIGALTYGYVNATQAGRVEGRGDVKLLDNERAQREALLAGPIWVDQQQKIVRVPVDRAMELVLNDWKNGSKAIHWLPPADSAAAPAGDAQPKAD